MSAGIWERAKTLVGEGKELIEAVNQASFIENVDELDTVALVRLVAGTRLIGNWKDPPIESWCAENTRKDALILLDDCAELDCRIAMLRLTRLSEKLGGYDVGESSPVDEDDSIL